MYKSTAWCTGLLPSICQHHYSQTTQDTYKCRLYHSHVRYGCQKPLKSAISADKVALDDEAMFISFSSLSVFAIKIFLGPINVITGDRSSRTSSDNLIRKEKQDYIVTPEQRWIDGIVTGPDEIRQFVATATTKGSRYSVEAHLKKSELKGGFSFVVVLPKNPLLQSGITSLPSSFHIYVHDKFGNQKVYHCAEIDLVLIKKITA